MTDPAPIVRARSVGLGGDLPQGHVVPALINRLEDRDPVVRLAALRGAAQGDGPLLRVRPLGRGLRPRRRRDPVAGLVESQASRAGQVGADSLKSPPDGPDAERPPCASNPVTEGRSDDDDRRPPSPDTAPPFAWVGRRGSRRLAYLGGLALLVTSALPARGPAAEPALAGSLVAAS